jgi:hypothetical protein
MTSTHMPRLSDEELGTLENILAKLAGFAGAELPPVLFRFVTEIVATSNVDLLVQDEKHRVLLAWREDAFGHRINSCAKDEFGCALAVAARPVALIQIFDDRGHSISMCYTAALQGTPSLPLINEGDVPEPGSLRWFDRPPLALYPSHLVYSFVIEALQQGRLGPGIEVFTQHVGRRDAAQGSSAGAISADEPLTTLTEPTAPKPGKAMNSGKQA